MRIGIAIWFFLILIFAGCQKDEPLPIEDSPYVLNLPQGFPSPVIPESNPLTTARIELGKKLFFDKRLSVDNSISCASCHNPDRAFTDGKALSVGVNGNTGTRNAPTLFNVVYNESFNYDGGTPSLEAQLLVPIQDHREMASSLEQIVQKLKNDPEVKEWSLRAFRKNFDAEVLIKSIAAYERTLISGNSKYDDFLFGLPSLNKSEMEGLGIFKLHCESCHSGFNFTNNGFENNGIYVTFADIGRARVTLKNDDIGKFKVPGLRNIVLTAPYMHDGSFESLEKVIDHYNSGGMNHFNQSEKIKPLGLTPEQHDALLDFLGTLTSRQAEPSKD